MKINGNEVRPGDTILHQDSLWVAVRSHAVKPGKGGAFAQVELKNITDGRKLNERFRATERIEKVRLEQKTFQYLYVDGDQVVFMDTQTYDQIYLSKKFIGEKIAFLADGINVTVESFEGKSLGVKLPAQVSVEVSEAEPVIKGQTATASYKPAVLKNGLRVMVPPFISVGETIVVDTDSTSYVRRAES